MSSSLTAIDDLLNEISPPADTGIDKHFLTQLLDETDSNPCTLQTNIVSKTALYDACMTRQSTLSNMPSSQQYSFEVANNACKPLSNQRSTGTCWLYATLNVLRRPFIEQYKLKKFELSVQFLFFWHKYELSNFWLESMLSIIEQPLHSRLVQYLLHKGCEDGSQFDSAVNLIEKYGVVPAVCNDNELLGMSNEVYVKQKSYAMNQVLNAKLREYAMILRRQYEQGKQDKDIMQQLRKTKKSQMAEIYRVLVIHFGKPVEKFHWNYRDPKTNEFRSITDLSPLEFYRKYVRSCYDLNKLVSLVHDPRNEYYRRMTVEHYGNVVGGKRKQVEYVNVPMEVLKQCALTALKKENTLWFACDIGWYYYAAFGSLDCKQFDFERMLKIGGIAMSKRERLEYAASINSHSMVLVGVDQVDDGVVTRWKVENSWGDKKGNKGYVTITDEWFDEFVYQVIVDTDMLHDAEVLNALHSQRQPIVLPRWDPFAQ